MTDTGERSEMGWMQIGTGCWESEDGYRIAIGRVRGELRYCVFSPVLSEQEYTARLRERYPRGIPVPQRRELLGCVESAEMARELRASHAAGDAA